MSKVLKIGLPKVPQGALGACPVEHLSHIQVGGLSIESFASLLSNAPQKVRENRLNIKMNWHFMGMM